MISFLLGWQEGETLLTPTQGWVFVIGAISSMIVAIATVYWKVGSKARIAEMNARGKLEAEKARVQAADVQELTIAYETALGDMKDQHDKTIAEIEKKHDTAMARLQAHVDLLDQKLDASEARHAECMAMKGRFEGMLEILQKQQQQTCQRVDTLANDKGNT